MYGSRSAAIENKAGEIAGIRKTKIKTILENLCLKRKKKSNADKNNSVKTKR
jgi:hypothetical protein